MKGSILSGQHPLKMVSTGTSVTTSPHPMECNNFNININPTKVMGHTQSLKAMMKVIPKSCPQIFLTTFIVRIVGGSLLN